MGDRPETQSNQIPLLEKSQVRGALIVGGFFLAFAFFATYGASHPFPGDPKPMGPIGYFLGAMMFLMAYGALKEPLWFSGWSVRLDDDALAVFKRGREVRLVPWIAMAEMRYRGPAIGNAEYSHIDILGDKGQVLLTVPIYRQSRARKWEKLDLIKKIEDRMPPQAKRLGWPWEQTVREKPPNAALAKVFLSVGVILGLPSFFALLKVSESLRTDLPPMPILQPFVNVNGVLILGGVASVGAVLGFLGLTGLARLRWPGAFETRYGDDAKPYFEFMSTHGGRPRAVQLETGKTYRYAAPRHHLADANLLRGMMFLLYFLLGVCVLTVVIIMPEAKTAADVWAGWALAGIGLLIVWYCEWGRRVAIGLALDVESRFAVSQSAVTVHRKDGTGIRCDLPARWPKPKRKEGTFGSVLGRLRSGKEVIVVDPRYLVEVDES